MEYRPLGSTGIEVGMLGLGTVGIGRTAGLKYASPAPLPSDAQLHELLDACEDVGVNLIDTAAAYGVAEERLGEALAHRRNRDRWVLSTKAGEEFEEVDGVPVSRFDFSAPGVRASVERSLRRLRTARLDCVLIHSDGDDARAMAAGGLDELERMRDAGDVGAVGASVKTVEGGMAAIDRCDVLMVTLNRRDREMEPVVRAARRRGVGVMIKKPLASGHDADRRTALRAVAETQGVDVVVVGTTSAPHMRENARALTA